MSETLPAEYLDRFSGIARLYGADALPSLINAHVAVIGIGGVGSWTAEALARSGVGTITLIDMDEVCVTNVNRQLPAHDGNVGRFKVHALAERLKLINPEIVIREEVAFFNEKNADAMLCTTPFRPQVGSTHTAPAPRPAPQVISNFAFGHSLGISGWAAASVVFATLFYRVYRSQLMINAEK